MCGADWLLSLFCSFHWGSSPRVRSRRVCPCATCVHRWIISACAEQTRCSRIIRRAARDHLRVCGADMKVTQLIRNPRGSSPRVRSRLTFICALWARAWIISACAEQTFSRGGAYFILQDHLRVCGADRDLHRRDRLPRGSSPRVRSRLLYRKLCKIATGIISACAEQTGLTPQGLRINGDHLRVCGADNGAWRAVMLAGGSSPRVRSRPNLRRPSCLGAVDHLRVCGAD